MYQLLDSKFVYFKNKPFPSFHWIKTSNSTHGYIRCVVDFTYGPKPMSAYGYHARTLTDHRFVLNMLVFIHSSYCFIYFK